MFPINFDKSWLIFEKFMTDVNPSIIQLFHGIKKIVARPLN